MIKVLFVIPNLSHGGAEKVLVNLVNNMNKSKFDITVQTLFDCGVNKKYLNEDIKYKFAFKKQVKGNSKLMLLFSPKTLYKRIIKEKYDIIVSYLEGPTARIVSGCGDKKTKKVSWIHIEMKTMAHIAKPFRNIEEARNCYNAFDKTICVAQTVLNDFTNAIDFKGDISVLYNTNETAKIKKLSQDSIDDLEFDKNIINIISVAKIIKPKGYERLARIHKKLVDDGFAHKFYILGLGDQKENIEKYLKENGLLESFVFLGYRDNPYKYVKNADLYVCSSYAEGFSTSVTEALIVGTPIVTTRCSGMEEMLGKNNEYGIVTDNDEESLYKGIKEVLMNKELLKKYAVLADKRGNKFSTANTVLAVEEMLEDLYKGKV